MEQENIDALIFEHSNLQFIIANTSQNFELFT